MSLVLNYKNATDVRKEFSETINSALYIKPQFIKRNRNILLLLSDDLIVELLSTIKLDVVVEKNKGLYIVYSNEIDNLLASGNTQEEAIDNYCLELYEYACQYYEEYNLYSSSPNHKSNLAYVLRVLCLNDVAEIKGMIKCQVGKI